jgi:hypothetical protein
MRAESYPTIPSCWVVKGRNILLHLEHVVQFPNNGAHLGRNKSVAVRPMESIQNLGSTTGHALQSATDKLNPSFGTPYWGIRDDGFSQNRLYYLEYME